jgi:hypothetical protein
MTKAGAARFTPLAETLLTELYAVTLGSGIGVFCALGFEAELLIT